jgi:hypothetical protein
MKARPFARFRQVSHSIAARFAFAALSLLIAGGCAKIDGQIHSTFNRSLLQDFEKSEIITNGPAAADGQSELLVVIQLKNSNQTPVSDYKPIYAVTSGLGVAAGECTTSNVNGVSTCVLKSTQAGTKHIAVTNVKIALEKDVVFTQPTTKSSLELLADGKSKTSGSYKFSGTIGSQSPGIVKSSGHYQFFGGVQGDVFSR